LDFGEALVMMRGRPLQVQLLVVRLGFSKAPFLMAFPHQRQEALFEGHKEAFPFFGGVPHSIWYDHLSQALRPSLAGRKPQEQEAFIAFRSHYLFESRFCRITDLISSPQSLPPGTIISWGWQCCLGLLEQNMELLNLFVLANKLALVHRPLVF
jgi:hypothetical protein